MKSMFQNRPVRLALGAPVLAASMAAAGCISSPTYGTGTSANVQLIEDVTGILSLAPGDRDQIEYAPRPTLVTPASTQNLPPPQDGITASNAAWPESPEQRRARIRADATANQENIQYRSGVVNDAGPSEPRRDHMSASRDRSTGESTTMNPRQQREEFNRRLAENRQGSASTRRYLSEPPLDYRQPSASAPVDDVGEDEWRKEQRLRREAGASRGWRDYVPWL